MRCNLKNDNITAKYLMSSALDNKICLYDLRGQLLKTIDGKVSSLYDCRLSPDGRFVIVSGFTPDVFVFEPTFSRDGAFQNAKKVFTLSVSHSELNLWNYRFRVINPEFWEPLLMLLQREPSLSPETVIGVFSTPTSDTRLGKTLKSWESELAKQLAGMSVERDDC